MAQPKTTERDTSRVDSVKAPETLPDASPLDRMTELTRRIVGVPKDEAFPPKKQRDP